MNLQLKRGIRRYEKKRAKTNQGSIDNWCFFSVIIFLLFSSIFINFLKGNENFQDRVTDFGTIPGEVFPWILFAMVCSSAYWIYDGVKKISKIRRKRRKK